MSEAQEPLKLTLPELVQYLGERNYWLGHDAGLYIAMPVDEHSPALPGTGSTPWEAATEALPRSPVVARDDAAELRAALRILIHDLEALMEESHVQLYDGDGALVDTSWGKLLQGGKDEYLSNWREVRRLADGESEK